MNAKDFEELHNLLMGNLHIDNILKRGLYTQPAVSLILDIKDEKEFNIVNTKDNLDWTDPDADCLIFRYNKYKYSPLFIQIAFLLHKMSGSKTNTFSISERLPKNNYLQLKNIVYLGQMVKKLDVDIDLNDLLKYAMKKKKLNLLDVVKMYYEKLNSINKDAYENTIKADEIAKTKMTDDVLIKEYINEIDSKLGETTLLFEKISQIKSEVRGLYRVGFFDEEARTVSEEEDIISEKLLLIITEFVECANLDYLHFVAKDVLRGDMDYFENLGIKIDKFINEIDLKYVSPIDKLLLSAPLITFRINIMNFYSRNFFEQEESLSYILTKKGVLKREFQIKYIKVFYDRLKEHNLEEKPKQKLIKIMKYLSEFTGLFYEEYKKVLPKDYNEESLEKILKTKTLI
jgi:hypothetical protein